MDKGAFTFGMRDAQSEAETGVARIANAFHNLGRATTQAGLALTAGITTPLVGFSKAVFEAGNNFESAFAGVAKTFPGTVAQLEDFRDAVREMALEMPAAATEISATAEAAGQLGISATALESFTRVMIQLGETTNLSAGRAATELARIANILQTSEQDYDRLGATLVDLGNNFATTEQEIVAMSARIAGAGQVVGLTESQVLSLATALSSVGVRVQAGGSAISRVFITMANAIEQGSEDLELFASTAGVSVEEFATLFEEDATKALLIFLGGLQEFQEQGKNVFTLLDDLELGEIRVRDALLRLAGAQDLTNRALATGEQAWKENIALTEEYERRVDTVQAQLDILKNRFIDVGISIFDAFRPEITSILEGIADRLDSISARIREFVEGLDAETRKLIVTIVAVGAALGPALVALGGIALIISTLANPIGLAATAIGTLAAAFVVLKTNSDLFEERIPTLIRGIENLKSAAGNLAITLVDVADKIGLIETSDATGEVEGVGVALDALVRTLGLFGRLYLSVFTASIQITNLLIEAVLTLIELLDPTNFQVGFNPSEFFRDPLGALQRGSIGGLTVDWDTEDIRKNAQGVADTATSIWEGAVDTWDDIVSIALDGVIQEAEKKLGPTIFDVAGPDNLRSGRFFNLLDEFVLKGARSFDLIQKRAIEWADDFGNASDDVIQSLKNAESESELYEILWAGVVNGVISTNELLKRNFLNTAEGIKFLEQNTFDWASSIEAAQETALTAQEAMAGFSTAQEIVGGQVTSASQAVSHWETRLANINEAIDIYKGLVKEGGDETGEYARKIQFLEGQAARVEAGLSNDLNPALADSIVVYEELQNKIEELNKALDEGDISPEQYAEAQREITRSLQEAEDPTLQLIGHQRELAGLFSDVVEEIRDLLIELGIFTRESEDLPDVDFDSNASDRAEDIGNLKEKTEEVPSFWETRFDIKGLDRADQIQDYGQAIDHLPEDVVTHFTPEVSDAVQQINDVNLAIDEVDNAKPTFEIIPLSEVASIELGSIKDQLAEIDETDPEFFVNADIVDAQGKLKEVDLDLFELTNGVYVVTIDANIQPLLDGIAHGREFLPSSPAERGPLAFTPNWDWLFEGVAESAEHYTDETIQKLQNFVSLSSSILDLFGKSLEFSGTAQTFSGSLPSTAFLENLSEFAETIVLEIGTIAAEFETEFLESSNEFNTAAQAGLSTLTSAIDAVLKLGELGGQLVGNFQLEQVSAIKFLVEHLVQSIGDAALAMAESRGIGFIALSEQFATSAQASLELIIKAVDAVRAIALLGNREISQSDFTAISQIKFLIEHLVLSIGDSAAFIESGSNGSLIANAEALSNSALIALEAVNGAIEAIKSLTDLRAVTDADFDAISNIKFLIEHLVRSLGDSAAIIEFSRGGDFLAGLEEFASVALQAVELLSSILEFLRLMESSLDLSVGGLLLIDALSKRLADISLIIVQNFQEVAEEWKGDIEGSITAFATAVGDSVGAITSVLDFLRALEEGLDISVGGLQEIDVFSRRLSELGRIIADNFVEASEDFDTTIVPALQDFATAIQESTASIISVLEFLRALEEGLDITVGGVTEVQVFARRLSELGRIIAEEFSRAADEFEVQVSPNAQLLADTISQGLGAIGDVLSFLSDLTSALNPDEGEVAPNFGQNIRGIAKQLAQRGREAAEAFAEVISTWEIEADVKTKVSDAATVIQDSLGAIGDIISLMEQVTDEGFKISGGQLRSAARQIAELGVHVGNIFAEAGLSLHEDSQRGLEVYALWFDNIESIFSFLERVADSMPDAVQNAYTFRDAAREIATAIKEGMVSLSEIGSLSDIAFSGTITTNAGIPNVDSNSLAQSPQSSKTPPSTLNLTVDFGDAGFKEFVIDTVNETIEEVF